MFGILFLLGFAAAVITGMLYKIVAFLVWLHRFSRLAGKVNVPLLRDIIPPRQTQWQLWSYLVMLGLMLGAAITPQDGLARLAGLAMTLTFGWIFLILLGAARFHPDPAHAKPLAPSPEETGEGNAGTAYVGAGIARLLDQQCRERIVNTRRKNGARLVKTRA